jgi:hypothetical protein
LKQLFFFLLLTGCSFLLPAQVPLDTMTADKKDTVVLAQADSNNLLQPAKDTVVPVKKETVISAAENYYNQLQKALVKSSFLNSSGTAVATVNQERAASNSDQIFYFLLSLVILLSFLRFFFSRYFFNLFRVFFNTSLRQGQLTDQLLQAKQASMFFNILFFFTTGIYIYFLLFYFGWIKQKDNLSIILISAVCISIIYFLKFISMKFTGWLTGHTAAANTYLFIISVSYTHLRAHET